MQDPLLHPIVPQQFPHHQINYRCTCASSPPPPLHFHSLSHTIHTSPLSASFPITKPMHDSDRSSPINVLFFQEHEQPLFELLPDQYRRDKTPTLCQVDTPVPLSAQNFES